MNEDKKNTGAPVLLRLAALAAFLLAANVGASESVSLSDEKTEFGDTYRIEGIFDVDAQLSQVWQVLTDYDGLKGVVSTVLSSSVLERKGNSVVVEQTVLGRFLFFSRSIGLTLRITEEPQSTMSFEEISGADFRLYRGSWKLESTPKGTRVTYRLQVSSADMAPVFMEKGLFRDGAQDLLRELKAEIVRRNSVQAAGQARPKG